MSESTVRSGECIQRTVRIIFRQKTGSGDGSRGEVLDIVDFVLVMSVNPGFGGQKFIPNALNKVRQLAIRRRERGLHFAIEIDGGVSLKNVADVVDAGVEWVVAGSAIFHSVNPGATFLEMQQAARNAAAVQV